MEKQEWYAVQVRTGKEQITAELCHMMIDEMVLKECFIPRYERMRRYQGQWHKEQQPMFPGYLFMVTEYVDGLFEALKQIPQLTKILGDGAEFIPLKESEIKFLLEAGGEKHLVEMSVGYIVGEQVVITSGPLENMAGLIRSVDRHKRMAVVGVDMFGRKIDVKLGLEIVRKE